MLDKAIANYVAENKDRLVESGDSSCVEDTTGEPLGWMFDQWVTGREHHPSTSTYADAEGERPAQLTVHIEQTTEDEPFTHP